MTEGLRFRNPTLVVAILGYVYDAEEPIPWEELLGTFAVAGRSWKTVENVLYELVAFGALHRIGKPAIRGGPDTRAVKPTVLGRAWLDGDPVPLPGREHVDELDEIATIYADDLELPIHTLEPGSEP